MSAENCPACGGQMSDVPTRTVLACAYCGCFLTGSRRDQIEARTLARIEEAEKPLVEALESVIDAGLLPNTSAREGGAARFSVQVAAADKVRDTMSAYKARQAEKGKT